MKKHIPAAFSRALVLIGLSILPWSAKALDLGTLHWKTPANQPPYAEIELRDKALHDIQTIRANLATREAYAAAGLNYHPALAVLRISVQPGPDGQASLKLEQLPQDGESLDLLIVVNNRLTLALAEYRVDLRRGAQDLAPSPAGTLQLKKGAADNGKPGKSPNLPPPPADQETSGIRQAIEAWAQAWSRRDVDAYLAAYSPDFPGSQAKLTHRAWAEQRKALILARQHISVELSEIRLERQGERFVASFTQQYRSDGPNERSRKRLLLGLENGRWLILKESAGH